MSYRDALKDYNESEHSDGHYTRTVFRRGIGPAVIIIHEIPGLHPQVIRFADRVAAAGMTVFLPSLFGEPGRPVTIPYALKGMFTNVCIRREFRAWATDQSSPIVDWLRSLARKAHAECGGRGVGAVGMCFTGNFALAMMTEPAVVAPVLSQPSLPIGIGRARKAAIGVSADEIACAQRRFAEENLSMIGLRFHGDPLVPAERFDTFKKTFGDRFEAIELDGKDGLNVNGTPPHSVLTVNLRDDDPDGPTKRAERRVIEFFKERVGAT
jgi:dienelactone hydrolase